MPPAVGSRDLLRPFAGRARLATAGRRRTALGMLVGVGGVAAVTAVLGSLPFEDVGRTIPTLVFMLLVVAASVIGRLLAGAAAAVAGFVATLLQFTPPSGTVNNPDVTDIVALIAFAVVSVTVSWLLSAQLRARAEAEGAATSFMAVLRRLPVGVAIAEAPSGEILVSNERARTIWRTPNSPFKGYDGYRGFHPDGREYTVAEWPLLRALRDGETVTDEEIDVIFNDGDRGLVSASAAPIVAPDGSIAAAVVTLFDLTEHRRVEDQTRFLAEASDLLAETLDPADALRRLTELAVPALADWCAVALAEGDGIRTVAVHHSDPAKVDLVRELDSRFPPDPAAPTGAPRAIRTGRSELVPEITDAFLERAVADPELLGIARELGFRSAIFAPLLARGRTIGALTLVSAESGRRYTERDLDVAEDLAHRAALAVDNARLYQGQRDIARTLQASLLPRRLPALAGLDTSARYRPAGQGTEVGGDFYDVWPLGGDAFGVAVGDVCGKGPEAAALTALTRHTIRAESLHEPTPSRVLTFLNEAILAGADGDRFCTVVYGYGRRTPTGVRLTLTSGGHPLPFLVRADGTVERAGGPGMLLGVFEHVRLHDFTYDLRPGDLLVLWTDGVSERRREREQFGERRLADLVATLAGADADEAAERIDQAVVEFAPGAPQDDVAIVTVRVLAEAGAGSPAAEAGTADIAG